MAQLMQHNQHGFHYATNPQDQASMELIGWKAIDVHPAIAKSKALDESNKVDTNIETPKPKLGRPFKG